MLRFFISLLSSNKNLLSEYTSKDEIKKIMTDLFKSNFSGSESVDKTYFIQNIILSINKAKNMHNIDYIPFVFQIVNSLLDNLICSQTDTEGESDTPTDKDVFTPDSKFFELYSNVYKAMTELKGNNGESSDEKETSDVLKVYQLIMKNIQKIEEDKKIDIKIFVSLLQLLKSQINDNDKLKKEILFKETDGRTLFNYLLQKNLSNLKKSTSEEEPLISTDNNDTSENEENKFICLENLKEEKKDNSSDEELIEISNEFIINCLEGTKEPKLIAELFNILRFLKKSIEKNGNSDSDDNEKNEKSPLPYQYFGSKSCGYVGLKNLGCICYMNSIMQQMYNVPTFRYAIMSADDKESPNPSSSFHYSIDDDNLLHQLQNMFTYLTFSDKMDYNPKDFCFSYKDFDGNPINVRTQQDSQEFYNNLCDKIENSLKKTKYKYIVSDVFAGKTCRTVLCENCKHISYIFEDYYNLTLEVKNINNLKDSLNKLNVPEIIDDFKCSNCE
jgi:ubiquitin carboxyl-terminal hydrolase 34